MNIDDALPPTRDEQCRMFGLPLRASQSEIEQHYLRLGLRTHATREQLAAALAQERAAIATALAATTSARQRLELDAANGRALQAQYAAAIANVRVAELRVIASRGADEDREHEADLRRGAAGNGSLAQKRRAEIARRAAGRSGH